jgi:hypothetical protein
VIIDLVKKALAAEGSNIEPEALAAFLDVESAGKGFSADGKLIIQFEPKYFKRLSPKSSPDGVWDTNQVQGQQSEWAAFNSAFKLNALAAMGSCSIGMPQIMGTHWKRLGYSSVGAMWDDFKTGEQAQVNALVRFVKTDSRLEEALKAKDWTKVATIYNGAGFREIAKKYGGDPYDMRLDKAYNKRKKA